jgi:formylmethanofuran dehydrogenase subunit E
MGNNRIMLNEAKKFHGHLGPYLVLGILAGEFALKRLRCKKYFGLEVRVWGTGKKPKSCFIDGLQLSTGATYGKGNIHKLDGRKIKIEFCNPNNNKKFILRFRESLIQRLEETKTHRDSELLAKRLYKTEYNELFNLTPNT